MNPRTRSFRSTGRGLLAFLWLAAPGAGAAPPDDRLDLECLIEPNQTVRLSSPVEGQLREVLVDRGDIVEAGQVLAVLESDVERASHELSLAHQEFETQRLERKEQLFEQSVLSEQDLDDARESRRIAALEAERSGALVEQRAIRSPIDGVVVRRLREAGEFTDPPEVFELAQIQRLRVETFAPAEAFGRIARDADASVVPDLPGAAPVPASISVIDPVVDAASGTFGIRLEIDNSDHGLPAGVGCRVQLELVTPAVASNAD